MDQNDKHANGNAGRAGTIRRRLGKFDITVQRQTWVAMLRICEFENIAAVDLLEMIDFRKKPTVSLSGAVGIFTGLYFGEIEGNKADIAVGIDALIAVPQEELPKTHEPAS